MNNIHITKKTLLVVVLIFIFFILALFLQKLNHYNNYFDFVDSECSGKIEKIVVSSVGTAVHLGSEEILLFSPEDHPSCGFFHNCYSKGDHINKSKGEDFVTITKEGSKNVIIVKSSVDYESKWLYFHDKSLTIFWVLLMLLVFLTSITLLYFLKAKDYN